MTVDSAAMLLFALTVPLHSWAWWKVGRRRERRNAAALINMALDTRDRAVERMELAVEAEETWRVECERLRSVNHEYQEADNCFEELNVAVACIRAALPAVEATTEYIDDECEDYGELDVAIQGLRGALVLGEAKLNLPKEAA